MQIAFQLHLFDYSSLYIIFIFHNTNNVSCLVVDYTSTTWQLFVSFDSKRRFKSSKLFHLVQKETAEKYNTELYLSPGRWLWLDKTVMDYTNWADDELRSSGSYGVIRTSDGTWSAGSGWYDRAYICKTAKGETIIFKNP